MAATAASGSVAASNRNELFVDIIEKLNLVFDPKGTVLASSIDGSINMKSFLQDNPVVKMQLDPKIVVGRTEEVPLNSIVLDDCNFHECMDLGDYEDKKLLNFYPPEGEFIAMNYRITKDFAPPFRVFPHIEQEIDTKIEIILKIKCEIPKAKMAKTIGVVFHAPSTTAACHLSVPPKVTNQVFEYKEKAKTVLWMIPTMEGESEHILRCVFSLDVPASPHFRKEIGPFM